MPRGRFPHHAGPVPPKILVPRSWYQDAGTKILVPKKTESLRGRASQKLSMGARGSAGPPRTAGGLGGGSPPSKNNLMVSFYGETHTPLLGQGFQTAWLTAGQKFPCLGLNADYDALVCCSTSRYVCQEFMRVAG